MAKHMMRILVLFGAGVTTMACGVAIVYAILPLLKGGVPGWLAQVFTPGRYDAEVLSLGAAAGVGIGYFMYPLHCLLLRAGLRLAARVVPSVLPWPSVEAYAGRITRPTVTAPTTARTRPPRKRMAQTPAVARVLQ